MNKCRCLKDWEEEGVGPKCENYCCNPDADPDGEWCFVEDHTCEDSDWGYCEPATASSDAGKDVSVASACVSSPSWADIEGDDCATYAAQLWCTKDARPGVGWHSEWGTLNDFKADEMSALEACCACGGGTTPVKEVTKNAKMLV